MYSTLTSPGCARRFLHKSPPAWPQALNLSLETSVHTECSFLGYQPMLPPCDPTQPCTTSTTSGTNLFVALPDVSLVTSTVVLQTPLASTCASDYVSLCPTGEARRRISDAITVHPLLLLSLIIMSSCPQTICLSTLQCSHPHLPFANTSY